MEIQYYEIDEPFSGEYTEEECPECTRERIMLCQDGKRHCEKCGWCIEDNGYQGEWYQVKEKVWK